jgi:hypothetical protein
MTVVTTNGKKTRSNRARIDEPDRRLRGNAPGPAAATSPVPNATIPSAVFKPIGIELVPYISGAFGLKRYPKANTNPGAPPSKATRPADEGHEAQSRGDQATAHRDESVRIASRAFRGKVLRGRYSRGVLEMG